MKKKITLLPFLFLSFFCVAQTNGQTLPYKNPSLSTDARVEDLLKRMTLEEKVGQLLCPMGWEMYTKTPDGATVSDKFKQSLQEKHTGMFWAVYRADPWTQKTLETGLNPESAAKAGNAIQRYALENTRLGIPVFIAEEAPHGHMAIGTTVFPAGISMAATWNPELLEEVATVISKEIRLQGGHIAYGPVLDLSRDPRWSRVEEAYGEDPVLTARMGAAYARGTGSGDLSKPFSTISTIKHFIAYGIPEGGHNGNTSIVGQRELHENFLPPFRATINAGALSVMTAYNSIDGIPCTSNKYLLTDVLRKNWGFKGFVVSDLFSIDGLAGSHRVAANLQEAGTQALLAGVDTDLGASAFAPLAEAVKQGEVTEADIDQAVARVLKLKFDMGLFDNPYVDPKAARKNVRSAEHIAVARAAAQQCIVLLENRNNILPLNKNLKRIAVIGPNADNGYNQLGDYTAPQEQENIKTVLDGIKAKMPKAQIDYVKGCGIRDTMNVDIEAAVRAAQASDIAIVVVGGSSARDFKTKYLETGAALAPEELVSDIESGEGNDRATLDLLGKQMELLKAVKATGKPLVVIYIQGRPLNMNWASENADALLTAWYPGQEGGLAIADVLWGDYNPAGRLPITVPRSVGQLPVYYNKKNPRGYDYVELTAKPLYEFGYGLSYTTFEYSNLTVEPKGKDTFTVSFSLKNTGTRAGEEVAQLYVRDELASTVQPIKQLKHFERVSLNPGETKQISFTLNEDDLSIIGMDMKPIVEPGTFRIMIGKSSGKTELETRITVK